MRGARTPNFAEFGSSWGGWDRRTSTELGSMVLWGCLAETSVRFSSVRLHLRPGSVPSRFGSGFGSVRFLVCPGSVRFGSTARVGSVLAGSVRFKVWRGSVRVGSHRLHLRFGPVRFLIWCGSADSNSHSGVELKSIRFWATMDDMGDIKKMFVFLRTYQEF